jgi:hypothetical protein
VLAFRITAAETGVRIAWDLAEADAIIALRLSVIRSGLEVSLHAGWLPATTHSWSDPETTAGRYRLWGMDRAGNATLLAEASWAGTDAFPVRLAAGPNPFRGSLGVSLDLPAGPARVVVFDVRGRAVRALLERDSVGETLQLAWDGRDDRGRVLPAGAYVVQAVTARGARAQRVVRLP